jgi:hypothetical protein
MFRRKSMVVSQQRTIACINQETKPMRYITFKIIEKVVDNASRPSLPPYM